MFPGLLSAFSIIDSIITLLCDAAARGARKGNKALYLVGGGFGHCDASVPPACPHLGTIHGVSETPPLLLGPPASQFLSFLC